MREDRTAALQPLQGGRWTRERQARPPGSFHTKWTQPCVVRAESWLTGPLAVALCPCGLLLPPQPAFQFGLERSRVFCARPGMQAGVDAGQDVRSQGLRQSWDANWPRQHERGFTSWSLEFPCSIQGTAAALPSQGNWKGQKHVETFCTPKHHPKVNYCKAR